MPGEIGLCLTTAVFLLILFFLRNKNLRFKFPKYGQTIILNWQIYNLIFGIILAYFTGIMAINMFRNPAPKLPFKTFQELQKIVEENKISILATGAQAFQLNRSFPQNSIEYVKSYEEGLEFVEKDRSKVFLGASYKIFGMTNLFDCKFAIIADSQTFPQLYAGIFFSKSAPKWIQNLPLPTVIAFRSIFEKNNRKYRPNLVQPNCFETSNKSIKIELIAYSLYLLAIGSVAAALAFALELLWRRNIQRMQKQMLKIA